MRACHERANTTCSRAPAELSIRRMNSWGSISFAVAVSVLGACTASDTVVAVNVNSASVVGNPSLVAITITQPGQSPVVKEFAPPTQPIDGGMVIKSAFFERVLLPGSWESGPAVVKVDAKDGRGVYLSAESPIQVRAEGAVAAFIDLGEEPEPMPMPMDAGTDAAAGDDAGR
jgi:hypothetical protein